MILLYVEVDEFLMFVFKILYVEYIFVVGKGCLGFVVNSFVMCLN